MNAQAHTKGGARLGYIRGEGRNQAYLRPEPIDDDLGEANPVSFLDAFGEPLEREP